MCEKMNGKMGKGYVLGARVRLPINVREMDTILETCHNSRVDRNGNYSSVIYNTKMTPSSCLFHTATNI